MLGMPMMFPPVVPWDCGPVMPAGILPATTRHCTGVGVEPGSLVSQPVVLKLTAVFESMASAAGGTGLMTQLPSDNHYGV